MDEKNTQEPSFKISTTVKNLASSVQSNMDRLYRSTFFSSPNAKSDLTQVSNKIHKALDGIISNNYNNTGLSTISSLYSRVNDLNKDSTVIDGIEGMFNDSKISDTLLSSYIENKYLKDLDVEIDTVCKYMPKLEEALETRRDNVLSADHFTKDFINIENDFNVRDEVLFNKRVREIKDKYNLLELIDDVYYKADKYGEEFIYIVPYSKAISKLLKAKDVFGGTSNMSEAMVNISEGVILCEGDIPYKMDKPTAPLSKSVADTYKFKLELNTSNMLITEMEAYHNAAVKAESISKSSLTNILSEAVAARNKKVDLNVKIDKGIISDSDNLDYTDFEKETVSDGLIKNNIAKTDDRYKINVPGCLVKRLNRYNIIPIYVEELCLGYYYLELKDMSAYRLNTELADPMVSMKSNTTLYNEPELAKQDEVLNYISGQLSTFIDSKFVNANQDLRKEIYMILKHNDMFNNASTDSMRVTFLPPEDVTHLYFNKDERTHRGVSSLIKALLPAKLYSGLYITNTIAAMTRGQDRRVYYVKQNIDTNIAKVLLTTIEQLKKTNFNIRQIENINQVMGIIGRFNDFVIPVGPSGDYPVQFEIMQGQQIDTQPELMEKLEQMAVNSTDVPLELIQARQSIDYAAQLTMTNSKFLRKVFKYQSKFQKNLSEIFTKIYNAEYLDNSTISITLPPPMFLNIANTNQIIDNTNAMASSIVEMEMADEQDELVKSIFTKNLKKHYLKSYIDMDVVSSIRKKSTQEAKLKAIAADDTAQ